MQSRNIAVPLHPIHSAHRECITGCGMAALSFTPGSLSIRATRVPASVLRTSTLYDDADTVTLRGRAWRERLVELDTCTSPPDMPCKFNAPHAWNTVYYMFSAGTSMARYHCASVPQAEHSARGFNVCSLLHLPWRVVQWD